MSPGHKWIDPTPTMLASLDADFRPWARWLVVASRQAGWPVIVSSAKRTASQQRVIFNQGRTTPGPILTQTMNSQHLSGRAVDLDLAGAARSVGMPLWTALGNIWVYYGGIWGGAWSDFGHFQG